MSAPIAKDQLAYQLPNQTYVDAHFEEPNLARGSLPTELPRSSFGRWVAARMAGYQEWRTQRNAMVELEMMSVRELMDIGLSRSDLPRVFDPEHNADLTTRGQG